METDKERFTELTQAMRDELAAKKKDPHPGVCVYCNNAFTAFGKNHNLCSRKCREAYLDRPDRTAHISRYCMEEGVQFLLVHRFGKEIDKVLSMQATMDWIMEHGEEDEDPGQSEKLRFWEKSVLVLSVTEGVDTGDHCLIRIS